MKPLTVIPAVDLLLALTRRGIRLAPDGDRLKYAPRSAMTPDLLAAIKTHKGELLAAVERIEERAAIMEFDGGLPRHEAERLAAQDVATWRQSSPVPAPPGAACDRCGATEWRDVPIHGGKSTRRDCARCGRFHDFPVWTPEADR